MLMVMFNFLKVSLKYGSTGAPAKQISRRNIDINYALKEVRIFRFIAGH